MKILMILASISKCVLLKIRKVVWNFQIKKKEREEEMDLIEYHDTNTRT